MPVTVRPPLHRPTEAEFAAMAYEVMGCVFTMHNEFGRLFDESIYKRELVSRVPGASLEVPIEIAYDTFHKSYYLDVLVRGAGVFEFKATDALSKRHRAQQMHYQLLIDLPYGKLVNLRPEQVEHEFINTPVRTAERRLFAVTHREWEDLDPFQLREWFTGFVCDLGTGLDLSLYEEALTHRLGGHDNIEHEISVVSGPRTIGTQRFRLVQPTVAFKMTTLAGNLGAFASQLRRLLRHVELNAIQWININRRELTFTTLRK